MFRLSIGPPSPFAQHSVFAGWNEGWDFALYPVGLDRRARVMLSTILIVVLILLLIGALPTWPYSTGWGYGPGGVLGLVLVIVLILALLGRI